MKSIRFAALLLFVASLAHFATAQTAPATGTSKIAILDTGRFDDPKAGITRYVQAFKGLETEFKPMLDEMKSLETRMKTISDEITKLSSLAVADPKSLEAKREQGQKLELDYKYKQEQYQVALKRRFEAVMRPLQNDIGNAVAEYGKLKGLDMIFDISKDEKIMLLWANMQAVDITDDFIKFYNARPATTAPPKAAPK